MIYWYNRKNKEKHNCTIPDGASRYPSESVTINEHYYLLTKVPTERQCLSFVLLLQFRFPFVDLYNTETLWWSTHKKYALFVLWLVICLLALFALMHCLCLCRVAEFLSFWVSESTLWWSTHKKYALFVLWLVACLSVGIVCVNALFVSLSSCWVSEFLSFWVDPVMIHA